MTFEKAKKILEKEGFELDGPGKPHTVSEYFTEFEDPNIYEAMQVVSSAGYSIIMLASRLEARKARLKKELEENSAPMPGPGEEQPKKENPALEESASQFNDALLDEQAKKIKRLGKEISKLNSIIHDKNAVLSDVAEELRLTKIREKNLADLGLKYVGENEKLKNELADKVVDKIDAQALKSAESALAYKEKQLAEKDEVIDKLTKENNDYKKVVEEFRNKIADMTIGKIDIQNIRLKEKDEVIADLGKELEEKTKLVEMIRKGSKEYCEYGIAAEKTIRKMANIIVYEGKVSSKEFEEYRRWANGYRYNPQLYDFIEEEEKKFSPVKDTHPTEDNPEEIDMDEILEYVRKALEKGHTVSIDYDKAEEGGDQSATIVECGKDIDDVFEEIKRLCQE